MKHYGAPFWLDVAGLFLLLVAPAYSALAGDLEDELAGIRKEGLPATPAELNEWYAAAPAKENAALIYRKAFEQYYTEGDESQWKLLPIAGEAPLPAAGKPWPKAMRAAVADYLGKNANALTLLHKAGSMPKCRWPVDFSEWDKNPCEQISHLAPIRQGTRLLALEALFHAHGGRTGAASRSLVSLFKLSLSLSREPSLPSQLTRQACQALGMSKLRRVLCRISLSDSQLADISARLARLEKDDGIPRALIGERCVGHAGFQTPDLMDDAQWQVLKRDVSGKGLFGKDMKGLGPSSNKALDDLSLADYRKLHLKADHLSFLRVMRASIDAARVPMPDRPRAARNLRRRLAKLPPQRPMTRLMTLTAPMTIVGAMKDIARLRLARTALAVERYRLAAAALPPDLTSIVPKYLPKVPADPYDGQPIRYKKRETGYLLYSIGEDGKDDGGNQKEYQSVPDITFGVAR